MTRRHGAIATIFTRGATVFITTFISVRVEVVTIGITTCRRRTRARSIVCTRVMRLVRGGRSPRVIIRDALLCRKSFGLGDSIGNTDSPRVDGFDSTQVKASTGRGLGQRVCSSTIRRGRLDTRGHRRRVGIGCRCLLVWGIRMGHLDRIRVRCRRRALLGYAR